MPKLDALTEAQRACLRLVLQRNNSKEIGLALGISSHAVDDRLKRAIAVLGVSTRFDAARLLAEHEGTTPQGLVPQPPEVVPPPDPVTLAPSPIEAIGADGNGQGLTLAEEQRGFDIGPAPLVIPAAPTKPAGVRDHALIRSTLYGIGKKAVWIMTAAGALLGGLDALARIFRTILFIQ